MKPTTNDIPTDRTKLLDQLWVYQNKQGYIRDEDLAACAKKFGMSEIELDGVVSFYHFFHRKPTAKFVVYLNNSIVAYHHGFEAIKTAFEKATDATFNTFHKDATFALFETACIGLSDFEPAALINFYPFTYLTPEKVASIVQALKQGKSPAEICDTIDDHIRFVPKEDKAILFRKYIVGNAVQKLPDIQPKEVIEAIRQAQLRGMGGAFFPTAIKWNACAEQSDPRKFIVCNADEGEPGTFKDRVLLNSLPGLLLEGMIIAGYAVGASEGIIYLRAEYQWLKHKVEACISDFRTRRLLGKSIVGIPGFDFEIRIQSGAGAYVCGEETALLNSLEGKRGEPRTKEFYPTEKGFLSKPTVVNNVETFSAAARIIELGATHFLQSGTSDSPGTKLISVSGDCQLPGIYEVEWGTSVHELLEMCKAQDTNYIQVSGPSGECIAINEKHRQLSMTDLRCGGSFMVFNKSRDLLKILENYTDFFKHESCGICTPCRAGNFIVQKKLHKIQRGLAQQEDLDDLKKWDKLMKLTSRCALGKMSCNSLVMALDKFQQDFENRIDQDADGLFKGFDLERASATHIRLNEKREKK